MLYGKGSQVKLDNIYERTLHKPTKTIHFHTKIYVLTRMNNSIHSYSVRILAEVYKTLNEKS